jgi:protein involved in sex pheromone biosynthesis
MKKTLSILALSVFLFAACNNSSEKSHEEGTHTHDDGSTHADHAKADTTKQEEFSVAGDTTKAAEKTHKHEDGKEHKH